jgi:hypothetical protein
VTPKSQTIISARVAFACCMRSDRHLSKVFLNLDFEVRRLSVSLVRVRSTLANHVYHSITSWLRELVFT